MEKLEDYHLERIGGELSAKGLKMVSVVYGMGIKQHELEDIESSGRDDEAAKKRSILIKWRNRTEAQKEDLANILHSSRLVDDETIEEKLDLENFDFAEIPFEQPSTGSKLKQNELGRLAKEIDKPTMDSIIIGQLRVPAAKVSNAQSDNWADHWSSAFDILVQWSYSKENTREKLIGHLKDGGVNRDLIHEILGGGTDTVDHCVAASSGLNTL